MPSTDHRALGWALGAALGLAVVSQVLPFLLPFEPGAMPPEALGLEKAESYAHPIPPAALAKRGTSYLALALVLVSGWAVLVESRWGESRLRWPMRLLFLAAVYAGLWGLGLPYGVMSFLHLRAYGLSDLTMTQWWGVVALGFPVPFATFVFAQVLIFCCMPLMGRYWWMGAALLLLVVFDLAPELLSRTRPLDPVETLTPLEEGPHWSALATIADTAGEELDFYLVDQSERTRHVNMYLTGRLGRTYVVLTDTLIDQFTPDEAAVILAHELGHNVTRHIAVPAIKFLSVVKLLAALWMVHLLLGRGPVPARRRLQTLVLVMLVTQVARFAFMPGTSALYRYRERRADRYALDLTRQPDVLAQALLKAARINLEPYDQPPWVYWLSATHPSIKERVASCSAWSGP